MKKQRRSHHEVTETRRKSDVIRKNTLHEITITEFRRNCATLIEEICKSRRPLRIVRFGKPLAEIIPASFPSQATPKSREEWIGSMKDSMKILGDIVSPVIDYWPE